MKRLNIAQLALATTVFLLAAQGASAGDLYRLDMVYTGPAPSVFPAHIQLDLAEGHSCDHLKGTATADFDGVNITNSSSDNVMSINSITINGSTMAIDFTANGYDHNPPKFMANSCFLVDAAGFSDLLQLHTSCSQPINLDTPYPGESGGSFTIYDGEGDCIDNGGSSTPDCPFDDKLFWLAASFKVPCASAGNVTFNVYDGDHFDNPKGTATAYFNGTSLMDITNDDVAQLFGAQMENGELVVDFEAFGFDHNPPRFKAKTSFEMVIEGCGTYRLVEYHTSCSQPITVDIPMPASPAGEVTISNFCGCDEGTVATDSEYWGGLKSLYR